MKVRSLSVLGSALFLLAVLAVLAVFTGVIMPGFKQVYAQEVSMNYQPVSNGQVLWLASMASGNVVMVSYQQDGPYHYAVVAVGDQERWSTQRDMLPGMPTAFTVSGAGYFVTIAVQVDGTDTVYVFQQQVPVLISAALPSTVYVPIVQH